MSGIENLRTRLNYSGGKAQIDRMNEDKLRSLRKALLYSYQSATALLSDGREFRCLINPDMIKNEYDNKIISIPFADICLNERELAEQNGETWKPKKTIDGLQEIGLKCGDIFTWKENGTEWLVYLQYYEETAYFRAELRRAKYEAQLGDRTYRAYIGDHSIDMMDWRKVQHEEWNELDYQMHMYITKDEYSEAYLKRFAIVEIDGKPWEVQATDAYSSDGIILVLMKEYYRNTIEEEIEKEKQQKLEEQKPPIIEDNNEEVIDINPRLEGPLSVFPYEIHDYQIENVNGGEWRISNNKAEIIERTDTAVRIRVTTGRSGKFDLLYIRENEDNIKFTIQILSL